MATTATATATATMSTTTTTTPAMRRTNANANVSAAAAPAPTSASASAASSLAAMPETAFERALSRWVLEPMVCLIPRHVSPNRITFLNVFVCLLIFGGSMLATSVEPDHAEWSLAIRSLIAFLVFFSILLDCLDGMHARRTGQCSVVGEVFDHTFDAANCPLIGATLLFVLQPDRLTLAFSLLATGMVYNSQLICYRKEHVMILPPISGPEAQFMVVLSQLAFGIFFFVVLRADSLATTVVLVFSVFANIGQVRNIVYFTNHLTKSFAENHIKNHLQYTAIAGFFAAIIAFDWLPINLYILATVCLSYRLNAQYLLITIVKKHKIDVAAAPAAAAAAPSPSIAVLPNGHTMNDQRELWILAGGIAIVFACGALHSLAACSWATIALCAYCVGANAWDLHQCLPFLHASDAARRRANAK